MLRVLFSGLVSGGFLLLARKFVEINIFNLILLGGFFVLMYLLLIFLTKSLDRNDLMIIKAIKNKFADKTKPNDKSL